MVDKTLFNIVDMVLSFAELRASRR